MPEGIVIRLVMIAVAVIALTLLTMYYVNNPASPPDHSKAEPFESKNATVPTEKGTIHPTPQETAKTKSAPDANLVMPSDSGMHTSYTELKVNDFNNANGRIDDNKMNDRKFAPVGGYPKKTPTIEDLLPLDMANSKWAQVNPQNDPQGVKGKNFLIPSEQLIGINTQGSSLKNPNMQLRSEPPNPRDIVGPWNQSSFEPDLLRRPLE
jgi:hypothetical protein